jgi:hypothetical protein
MVAHNWEGRGPIWAVAPYEEEEDEEEENQEKSPSV